MSRVLANVPLFPLPTFFDHPTKPVGQVKIEFSRSLHFLSVRFEATLVLSDFPSVPRSPFR